MSDYTVTGKHENDILTINIGGRLDAVNAEAAEKDIQAIIGDLTCSVILDAQDLSYISSTGLRVVLRLSKAHKDLKVINVGSEVYEIFEMTGFTEMLHIEKAYRVLSVDGCEVIGQGANGKVYRYDADTIVKVYFNADALDSIHRERELARKAFVLGVPTAISYDVVRVGDTYGSVFELLNAKSLSKLIAEEPENFEKYVGMFADLLKKIHATQLSPNELPDMKKTAQGWVSDLKEHLPKEQITKLEGMLEKVPESCNMMHGDYHTKNVMLQNGEALLIDMDTLCQGAPVFEMASVYNAFIGFGSIDKEATRGFLGIESDVAAKVWQRTLELYLGTQDAETLRRAEDKARVIGAVRLIRRTIRRPDTPRGAEMIEYKKNELTELLERVEDLNI